MGDKTKGLYAKYKKIERTDGKSEPGQKHEDCDYFILDLTHDPFAIPALMAYREVCDREYPLLALDLDKKLEGMIRRFLQKYVGQPITPELFAEMQRALFGR